MRKIKFRAWDKELKCMLKMDVQESQIWFGDVNIFSEILLQKERFELMQYTGLKDKNGKEIYEGDIWFMYPIDGYRVPQVITYEIGHLTYLSGYLIGNNSTQIEIMGNIYENPELLETK